MKYPILSSRNGRLTLFLLVSACALLLAPAMLRAAASSADTLTGRVLKPDNTPVKGATVRWIGHNKREFAQLAQAITDDAGIFRFANSGKLLELYPYPMLAAQVDGWGLSFTNIRPTNFSPDITLRPVAALQVPFVDQNGQPVAGVRVTLESLGDDVSSLAFCKELKDAFAQVTDARGICTLSGLAQGMRATLVIDDKRFAQLDARQSVQLGTEAVTQAKPISLLPAASLRGHITYAVSGKPVSGLRVYAWSSRGGRGEAVTDVDGQYTVGQLRPESYNLGVDLTPEQVKSWTSLGRNGVAVAVGQHLDGMNLTLISGAILAGKVTDAETHKPLAGVDIGVSRQDNTWMQLVQSGTDGAYLLHIPPGAYTLGLGNHPSGYLIPDSQGFRITVKDGEKITHDIPLSLSKVKMIHGRVLGPDEKPVTGAEVLATPLSREHYLANGVAKTDADGSFTLDPQGYGVSVSARCGEMATVQDTPLPLGGAVTLRLAKNVLCTLTGLVTDGTGEPVAGAHVTLRVSTDYQHQIPTAITDKDGHYSFPSLRPDKDYYLEATADGYGLARNNDIVKVTGKTCVARELLLNKIDSFIAGKVVDEHGKPLTGMDVYVSSMMLPYAEQSTDAEGRFRFAGIGGDNITISVRNPGGPVTGEIEGESSTDIHRQVEVNGQSDIVIVVKKAQNFKQ